MKVDNGKLKRCPSCGKFFACHDNNDCWCEHAHVQKKDLLVLMKKYDDCICQECLKQYQSD